MKNSAYHLMLTSIKKFLDRICDIIIVLRTIYYFFIFNIYRTWRNVMQYRLESIKRFAKRKAEILLSLQNQDFHKASASIVVDVERPSIHSDTLNARHCIFPLFVNTWHEELTVTRKIFADMCARWTNIPNNGERDDNNIGFTLVKVCSFPYNGLKLSTIVTVQWQART